MFNLFFMLRIAMKHWMVMAAVAIIAAASTFCYFNYVAEPQYTATGSIIVTNGAIITNGINNNNNDETSINQTDVATSLNFAGTVKDILTMPDLYKKLAHELGDLYTGPQLEGMATVERRNDETLFFDVTFTTNNPDESIKLVNKYLEISPDYISNMVSNSATSIQKADRSHELMSNSWAMVAIAGVVGAAVVYFIIFLIYSSDSIIRDEESFRERFDLPIIGVVPDFANAKSKEGKYYKYNRYYGYGGNKNAE